MFLIECTPEARPADFLLVAQNPTTYMCLGYSATGTEYAGDFSGYQARFGKSNFLGTYDMTDPDNPVPVAPTNATVKTAFNTWQGELRRRAYEVEADHLLKEAYRMDIDPKENATTRNAKRTEAIAVVDTIKARYPKIP